MTTKTTKTATVAAAALALVAVMLAYSTMILPASAQAAATTTSASAQNTLPSNGPPQWVGNAGPFAPLRGGEGRGELRVPQQANLTVGQTLSITSAQGKYYVVGDASENGTASGTVTFTVTGKLSAGWTVSITQGSIVVDGTTYTVSSGTAQMDRAATNLVGQGATTPSGQFLIHASAKGSFAGTTASTSLDLSAGTIEYLVLLSGTVKG